MDRLGDPVVGFPVTEEQRKAVVRGVQSTDVLDRLAQAARFVRPLLEGHALTRAGHVLVDEAGNPVVQRVLKNLKEVIAPFALVLALINETLSVDICDRIKVVPRLKGVTAADAPGLLVYEGAQKGVYLYP